MIRRKIYPLSSFKAIGTDGTFEAVVSVFNNIDYAGDRVLVGAFTNSLLKWQALGDPIPVIFSHQWSNLDAHVGQVLEVRELLPGDAMLPEAIKDLGGLYVKGQNDLEEPYAARLHKLMQQRRIKEFSFAYDILDEKRAKDGANDLLELELIEVGPTLKGMNSETQLIGAKDAAALLTELDEIREMLRQKTAIATHSTGTSDATWDRNAVVSSIPADATESVLTKMAAWKDPEGDATKKATYKFWHHFYDSGAGDASTVACSSGIGVLNGGRTGTTIPDADRQGVYDHLAKHLADAGQEPPELQKAAPARGTKAFVEVDGSFEALIGDVQSSVRAWARARPDAYDIWYCGSEATFGDRVIVYLEMWDDPYQGGTYYEAAYTRNADGEIELGPVNEVEIQAIVVPKGLPARAFKEGRRNSSTDLEQIQAIHDAAGTLGALCGEAAAEEPGADEEGKATPAVMRSQLDLELLETA